MMGYAGPGFVGTIAAIKRIVEARHPERWAVEAIPIAEAEIWSSLGLTMRGEFFLEILLRELPTPLESSTVNRIIDYQEAITILRDELVVDRIQILFRDDDGNLGPKIHSASWATDQGLEALCNGSAWLNEGDDDVCRFLILRDDDIANLLLPLATQTISSDIGACPTDSDAVAPSRPGRNKKAAEAFLRARAQGEQWPPLREDVVTIRAIPECKNLNREEIDQMRKTIGGLLLPPRGRPKKSRE